MPPVKIQQQFFNIVESHLDESEYKKRFLEELEEHYEDSVKNESLVGVSEKDVEKKCLQKIGDPKDLSRDFNKTIKSFNEKYLYLELIFNTLISVFFYFLYPVLVYWFVRAVGDSYFNVLNLIIIILFIIILPSWYLIILPSYLREFIKIKTKWLYLVLISWPVLVLFSLQKFIATSAADYMYFVFLFLLVFLFIYGLISIFISGKINRFLQNKIIKTKKNIFKKYFNVLKIIKYIFVALFIVYILASTAFSYWQEFLPELQSYNYQNQGLLKILESIWLADFILMFIFFISIFKINLLYSNIVFGFILIVLVGFCIFNLAYYFTKKKYNNFLKFPIVKLVVLILIINVLFLGNYNQPQIDWQLTSKNISKKIEKSQTGLFFKFIKYINKDEGNLFHYVLNLEDDYFIIKQYSQYGENINLINVFSVSELESINNYKINKKSFDLNEQENFKNNTDLILEKLPADFVCNHEKGININSNNKGWVCNELFYKDKLILKMAFAGEVKNIVFSEDKKFILINISASLYGPEYVYLAEI